MLEIGFWIFIILTLPLWGFLTLIWTIVKGIYFLFQYIFLIFTSIIQNTFDFWDTLYVGFVRAISLIFIGFNSIFKLFENFYYENTFLALILAFVCVSLFYKQT
jgi:hypothetical protein